MARIVFYDATELDKKQLGEGLNGTDHNWNFIADKISIENIDPDAEVVSIFVTSKITEQMIGAMPRLKLIACRSTGYNNVDYFAAAEKNITIVNVPTYGESTVAEYAFTLLLALTRKLQLVFNAENSHFKQSDLTGIDLNDKTIGIIGAGHIGQCSIRVANGFSMRVLAYDAMPRDELQEQLNFKYVELEELLQQSDFVTIHAPYLPATHHLINAKRLSLMKPEAIIVNTARGELIDTEALVRALVENRIGGAAIDVVEGEALLSHNEESALLRSEQIQEGLLKHSLEISILKKLPNVIVSPHNAFNSREAVQRINDTTVKNIISYWYGDLPNKVESPKKSRGKLMIARHTESEWNALNRWTGSRDAHLSEKGFRFAARLGRALLSTGVPVDSAYCSEQIRSRETIAAMLNASQQLDVDIIRIAAINERDYGDYTGKNKLEMKKILGDERYHAVRRGWDVPIPKGETLKMVYGRAIPFLIDDVIPQLVSGKNVLVVAHGNSIRAMIKYIESIADDEIGNLEMSFGEILIYELDDEGHNLSKDSISIDAPQPIP